MMTTLSANEIVMFGGYSDGSTPNYNDTWLLNTTSIDSPQWTEIATSSGSAASIKIDGSAQLMYDRSTGLPTHIFYFGGIGDQGTYTDAIELFDFAASRWDVLQPPTASRLGHGIFARAYSPSSWVPSTPTAINSSTNLFASQNFDQSLFYIIGGQGASDGVLFSDTDKDYNDQWLFNLTSMTWSQIQIQINQTQDNTPGPFDSSRSVTVGNKMFLFGGYSCVKNGITGDGGPACFHRSVFVRDLVSGTWTRLDAPIDPADPQFSVWPSARTNVAAALDVDRGLIFIASGASISVGGTFSLYNDVYAFDYRRLQFIDLVVSGTPPEPCWCAGMAYQKNPDRFLFFGGYATGNLFFDQLLSLEIDVYIHSDNCSASGNGLRSAVAGQSSGFRIQTAKTLFSDTGAIVGFGDTLAYGTGLTFSVQLVSSSSSSSSSQSNGLVLISALVVELGAGAYAVTYTITYGLSYQLFVQLDGENVPGSPFNLVVSPASTLSPSFSVASGSSLLEARYRETAWFSLTISDIYGNTVTVAVAVTNTSESESESGHRANITLQIAQAASWVFVHPINGIVTYNPPAGAQVGAQFLLGVRLNEQHISGSPFTVTVVPGAVLQGDQLAVSFSPMPILLSFVFAFVGSWTSLLLMEQVLSDKALYNTNRQRHRQRRLLRDYIYSLLFSAIPFAVCTVWATGCISITQISLSTSATLSYQPWVIFIMLLPVFALVCIGFRCAVGLDPSLPTKQVDTVLSINTDSDAEAESEPEGAAAAPIGWSSMLRTMGSTYRVNGFVGGIFIQAAFLMMHLLMLQYAIKCDAVVHYSGALAWSQVVCFVFVQASVHCFVHLPRTRYVGAFIMAAGSLLTNELWYLSLVWTYQPQGGASGMMTSDTLTWVSCAMAALVCFVFLYIQVGRMKVSHAVQDALLMEINAALSQSKKKLADTRKLLGLIHLLRPQEEPAKIAHALAEWAESSRDEEENSRRGRASHLRSSRGSTAQPSTSAQPAQLAPQLPGLIAITTTTTPLAGRTLRVAVTAPVPIREPTSFECTLAVAQEFFGCLSESFPISSSPAKALSLLSLRGYVPQFSDIVNHAVCLELFKDHCAAETNLENMSFYLSVEELKKKHKTDTDRYKISSELAYEMHVADACVRQANLSSGITKQIKQNRENQEWAGLLEAAQKDVFFNLLATDIFLRFKETRGYKICCFVLHHEAKKS